MADKKQKWFAIYPYVDLQDIKTDPETNAKSKSKIKRLLFGDYLEPVLKDGEFVTEKIGKAEYVKVHCRNETGFIKRSEMQTERPLEINFIDVGQGDGCHIVTPDDKHFLVDAGKEDNMYRFLKWRFCLSKPANKAPGFTVVITHSDEDHYKGFWTIFDKAKPKEKPKSKKKGEQQEEQEEDTPQIKINKIYHNGMIEGSGKPASTLGTLVTKDDVNYITDLCDTDADYKRRLEEEKAGTIKAGTYLNMLKKTDAPKVAVRAGTKEKPVYIYNKDGMTMEILGPVAEDVDGKPGLRVFGGASSSAKTKNGHSVIIKLTIGHLRLLLGGDLNMEAENHLMKHYSGMDVQALKNDLSKILDPKERETKEAELAEAITKAGAFFGVDIAKSCHHGSDEFTSEFLQAMNPIATVISSGDNESYCHPRPDTLGTIGKYSRSKRPMIFSTELARSGKEYLKLDELDLSAQKKKERVVTVYGMINVRTDGNRVIFAQKLEKKSQSGETWDIHQMEWSEKLKDFELKGFKE